MSLANSAATTRKPVRCLVIQLARLGDTLQSLMALRAAKQLYPELEIHFLARERFAAAARRVPWLEKVVTFPTDALLGPILKGEGSQADGLKALARWVAPLTREPWDLVINWSYSEASSYLTGLVPAKVKLGYSRQKDTSFSCTDGWSHYIQAIVQGGIHQNIHLTDILTTQLLTALQIHVGDPVGDGDAPVTSKSFFSTNYSPEPGDDGDPSPLGIGHTQFARWERRDLSRKWIAIQLGAAQSEKTWAPESWAAVANYILKRHPECRFVLLGSKDDYPRAKAFLAALEALGQTTRSEGKYVLSLVGETDFDIWASVVGGCQWLFSGDTAAVHLASVLGTRILNVSVGPVRWAETGPYGNGHYVIAAHSTCEACVKKDPVGANHRCREAVNPEAVYGTWSYGSNEWSHRRQVSIESHFTQLGWTAKLPDVRIFRSKIRTGAEGGGVCFEAMIHRRIELQEWTGMVMDHIARAWYCGWTPPIGQELTRESISPGLVQTLRQLDESAGILIKVCSEASRMASELERRSGRLRSDKVMGLKDRSQLQQIAENLQELDALISRLGQTHGPLEAFSQMAKVLMHNLTGARLTELGRESIACYQQIREGATILQDWVKHTLGLAKPIALKVAPVESIHKKPPEAHR